MLTEQIKHINYNYQKEILTVFYKNGEVKELNMCKQDYLHMLETGKFNF